MADNTKIEWADATVNFWHGCKKVSQGCKFCYMYRDKARYNQDPTIVQRAKNDTFYKALKWEERRIIFTCSWSDFFIKEADQWREDAWDVIRKTPQHIWLILTKRPERILQCLPKDWGKGWDNVWIGVSVENQRTAFNRIMKLYEIPCKIRFLSIEPLLEKVNIQPYLAVPLPDEANKVVYPIHWVIVGGESGNEVGDHRYRKCEEDWIRDIIGKCKHYDIPVFVKQTGTYLAKKLKLKDRAGADNNEPNYPADFRTREFPSIINNE